MIDPSFEGVVTEPCTCEEPHKWRVKCDVLHTPGPVDTVETLDGVNDDGRWHCLVVNGVVKNAILVEPSQDILDDRAADETEEAAHAQARTDFKVKKAELKAKKKGGTNLSSQDVEDLVELMVLAG